MSVDAFFFHTFDDYGATTATAASGGIKRTDVAVQKGVPCRIEDAGSSQSMRNGVYSILTKNRIFTQYTALANGHTIRYTDPTSGEAAVARVTEIQHRRAIGGVPDIVVIGAEWIRN
jgi:hypothetical protein